MKQEDNKKNSAMVNESCLLTQFDLGRLKAIRPNARMEKRSTVLISQCTMNKIKSTPSKSQQEHTKK